MDAEKQARQRCARFSANGKTLRDLHPDTTAQSPPPRPVTVTGKATPFSPVRIFRSKIILNSWSKFVF